MMTVNVPGAPGLYSGIVVELIQVRCLGMAEKREASVNKVSVNIGRCVKHSVIGLMP